MRFKYNIFLFLKKYSISKNNLTGGYIVHFPKLNGREKFKYETSYSEEIRKIDKKIKRLTNELIDYYIDKKRKAREEKKIKQKLKKEDEPMSNTLSLILESFEFL